MALLFSGDWVGAKTQLEMATALNPHEPAYWLDLSRTLQIAGHADQARTAADQALATGRTYGWVSWEAGLLFLAQGDYGRARQVFRDALHSGELPLDRVVDVCWHATHNTQLMLNSLLPDQSESLSDLIGILAREGRSGEADMVWSNLLGAERTPSPAVSFGYIDYLLKQGRSADAANAWRAFLRSSSSLRPYISPDNAVENGGFELHLLNGGLDWRYISRPDATVSIDEGYSHSGRRSLKIHFLASELWEAPLLEHIAVRPGTRYRLSASMSTRDMWTLAGPRLRLRDTIDGTQYLLSSEFTGTTPWTRVEQTLTTGPNTHLLTISIVRSPGNSSISGSLWLDDVSLMEAR